MPRQKSSLTIKQKLDAEKTVHNGLGYDDLVVRIELKVSVLQICRDFGFTPPTFYSIIKKDKKLRELFREGDYRGGD